MDWHGYAGRTLYVDLDANRVREEPLDPGLAADFIGPPGTGFRLLYDLLKPGVDPLSPDNVMVVGLGPLGGTLMPGSGRCGLAMKYPVPASRDLRKHYVAYSTGGSRRFGSMLKNAGYDQIVITGAADRPSYLLVTDEGVRIREAGDLWGLDIHQTSEALWNRHSGRTGKCGVWTIGPAGENRIPIAQATVDDVNSLGRNVGAVLGSKNLKAVVTLGARGVRVRDGRRFMDVYQRKRREILNHPRYRPLPDYHHPLIQQVWESDMVEIKACVGCLGACRSTLQARSGAFRGASYKGGDVSIPLDFGRRLKVDETGAMYALMDRLNRTGLCILTTLRMIYYVTRLFERGEITREDTGGLVLRMGDMEAYLALIDRIVERREIGEVMGRGWHALARVVGRDPGAEFRDGCSIIKGVDSLTDSRFWPSNLGPSMGLSNIVHSKGKHAHGATYWPAGPDRTRETYWPEPWQSLGDVKRDAAKMGLTPEEMERIFGPEDFNTGRLTRFTQDAEYLYNALGICDCVVHWECDPTRDVPWLTEMYQALTGFDISPREMLRAGERCYNMEKLLNAREGFGRSDDEVPEVWLQNTEIPIKGRGGERYLSDWFGRRLTGGDLENMLDEYYRERGWDVETGLPTRERLAGLGLNMAD
ncbi:MAG: hypothetical protein KKB20_17745 [Proteobacteria bacterium]|nr:hypothetical protein [Pseudomonadota bacterium]